MGEGETQTASQRGVVRDLWDNKAWRLLPLFVLYIICLTTLLPIKPNLMTDFFASRHSPRYIRCENYPPFHAPRACNDAHASVVLWSSWSDFFSNSILLFLLAPLIGRWSDVYGRKPFLIICFGMAALPVLVLVLHMRYQLSLYYYFPAQVLTGAFSSVSIAISYVADVMQPHNRAPAFGLLMASFSLGFLVGPALGGLLSPMQAGWLAAGGLGACMLWVIFMLPETLTPATKLAALQKIKDDRAAATLGGSNWHGLHILGRSTLFLRLTACTMLSGIVTEGIYELLSQYLQIKLAFNVKDMSHLYTALGATGMAINSLLLRALICVMGETNMLRFGLFVSMTEMAFLAFVPTKTSAILAMCAGTASNVIFPAIASIKANNVAPHEQGTVQGALYGARALAQGIGPLIFAWMFAAFTKGSYGLPVFPGAPFIGAAVVMGVSLVIVFTINAKAADNGKFLAKSLDDASAPLLNPALADEEDPVAQEILQDSVQKAMLHDLPHGPPVLGLAPAPAFIPPTALDLIAPSLVSRKKDGLLRDGSAAASCSSHSVHSGTSSAAQEEQMPGEGLAASWRLRADLMGPESSGEAGTAEQVDDDRGVHDQNVDSDSGSMHGY